MQEQCFNHPGIPALATCHSCNRYFCADCLVEGKEHYYCTESGCMRVLEAETLPKIVSCPHCREDLELSEEERSSRQFTCPACGNVVDFSSESKSQDILSLSPRVEVPYYGMSPQKLLVLCFTTLGVYEIYWFYRNWQLIRSGTSESLSPIWRSVFHVLFSYSMFTRVTSSAHVNGLPARYNPGPKAFLFAVLHICAWLPGPWMFVYLSASFVLVPIQSTINEIVERTAGKTAIDNSYSLANILTISLGSVVLFLCILGSLATE